MSADWGLANTVYQVAPIAADIALACVLVLFVLRLLGCHAVRLFWIAKRVNSVPFLPL